MTTANSHLSNGFLSLSVAPLGAEMQYLRSRDGADYLWNGDGAYWTGRAPVLFPIVGRAPGDVIATGDTQASMKLAPMKLAPMKLAPMKQHGFARRSVFALVEQTDIMCHHVLHASDETRAVYPFDFALHVIHRLMGHTVLCEARVENNGVAPMPFGFGFHPAFRWPLPGAADRGHVVALAGGGNPDRCALQDGLIDPAPLPGPFTDGRLDIAEPLFEHDALVFPNGSDALRYGPDEGPGLSFTFHNLPDLALWKPRGAPFLCIEPWHGTAARITDGPQIADRPNSVMLAPGEAVDFGYSVTVEP